jgi:hypothetical protein
MALSALFYYLFFLYVGALEQFPLSRLEGPAERAPMLGLVSRFNNNIKKIFKTFNYFKQAFKNAFKDLDKDRTTERQLI